jgi:hypothetical protein
MLRFDALTLYLCVAVAVVLTAFICCPQQISEWGMLSGHGHAFS